MSYVEDEDLIRHVRCKVVRCDFLSNRGSKDRGDRRSSSSKEDGKFYLNHDYHLGYEMAINADDGRFEIRL